MHSENQNNRKLDPDTPLIAAIAQGNTQALEELYRRHWHSLLAYLVQQLSDPHIAEEVLQDVMLAVWKSAATFRGDSKVYTWMLAIARHRAVTERQRKPRHQVDLNEELAADGISPPEVYERQSERERAYRALHNLPPEQRETMELIFYHGLTGPEVAQIMNVSVGTVKSRLRLAKAALHKCLTLKEVQDA